MSCASKDSFREWRSKRERDPSETRKYKRLITQDKINQKLNEKENQQLNLVNNELKNSFDVKDDLKLESNLNSNLNKNLANNINNDSLINNINQSLINESSNNSAQINIFNQQNDQMEHAVQSNQTLKEKLVSLNNSKFVIEEGEEDDLIDSDDLDGSEYNYNGEDLSENDENYCANEYPDEQSEDELDFYRPYQDNYEREMLEKFEKCRWDNDGSDYSDDDYDN